jgi:ubiquinone/menaquinone biosynthesis C-methylase UbiE
MSELKDEKVFDNLKSLFEAFFKKERSETFRNIFREVYGDDYPEEAAPDSFVTLTDLHAVVQNLNVKPGNTFVDLGCGRGGPGLWLARETRANYIGIDLSENAIEKANRRLVDFKIDGTAKFLLGNICSLELPDNSFDGAISIDVISFLPDPRAVFEEAARILRSKAFLIFTSWEYKKSRVFNDFRPFLQNAGFEIKTYSETPDWKQRQRKVYEKTLEFKEVLTKEMGKDGVFMLIMEAKRYLPMLNDLRRIIAVVMKV